MFSCGVCHRLTAPGEKAVAIVTKTREKTYPYRSKAHKNDNDDPGGKGFETVKEIKACPTCAPPVTP